MPIMSPQQISLGGGVNAYAAPHVLGEAEVATATNIDFNLQPGAAQVRFGSRKLYSMGASPVRRIFIHYKTPLENSVTYIQAGSSIYRGTASSTTFTSILTGANTVNTPFTQFDDHVYTIGSAGSNSIKDNGSTLTDWIKQAPSAALVIFSTNTATGFVITSTFTAAEGTLSASGSGTATFTKIEAPYRIQIDGSAITTNMEMAGAFVTDPVGNYGVHTVSLSFSDPSLVTRVSQDYSIGDATFANYWHADVDLNFATDLIPDFNKLIDLELTQGTNTNTSLSADDRQAIISKLRENISANTSRFSYAADSFNTWLVARPEFELISNAGGGWTNIQASRIVVEASAAVEVKVCNWRINGDSVHPLTDNTLGYMWWETYATIDNGVVIGESSPGPAYGPIKVTNAAPTLLVGGTATGSHGITHRILYRSGGLLPEPYAVSTIGYGTSTYVDTLSDIKALGNQTLLKFGAVPRSNFYSSIQALSEPHYGRIFAMYDNQLVWSDPNVPDRFGAENFTQVSHAGDPGQGLVVWPPGLVIINRDSVYELDGNIFEGPEVNYILRRTGARRGSKAPRTIVKTPYGIPLLDMDGLYMYSPGQGIEQPVGFVADQIGDAWKGSGSFDPASVKGNRVPAIQIGYINSACAEYFDNKYYLAMPTGTDTAPKTLFVIDFASKRSWWYTYPFEITALAWDIPNGRLLAGTGGGSIIRLNQGYYDENDAGNTVAVPWKVRTKTWTTPNDAVLENIQVEAEGSGGSAVAILDGTTTASLGTLTNTTKDWIIPALSGYVKNRVEFEFSGAQSTAVPTTLYGMKFDAIVEPPRVTFWRTEHELAQGQGDKIWDVAYADIEVIGTGTVTGVIYVDNAVVGTNLIVSTAVDANRTRREIKVKGLPAETIGRVAYTEYVAGAGVVFKHWNTYYNTRPLPDLVTSYVSDKKCGDEAEWKTFEPCLGIPTGGTVLATSILDGNSIIVSTLSGGSQYRQSYARSIQPDTFGRTMYTIYNSADGTTPFRYFDERYENVPEPDVMTSWKHGPVPYTAGNHIRTWIVQANPRGSMVGVLYADNVAVATNTFTGSDKQIFTVGLDVSSGMAIQTASWLEAYYTGSGFKHWNTEFEVEQKPFGKKTWSIQYSKVGGATQMDMARFWSWDIEAQGTQTATFTSIWDVDGTATHTQTFTSSGRHFEDRIPWPAGVRGQLFQQRVLSNVPINVWKVNLDMERIGVKGFSRVSYAGVPQEN